MQRREQFLKLVQAWRFGQVPVKARLSRPLHQQILQHLLLQAERYSLIGQIL